jgi:hypothetical protein
MTMMVVVVVVVVVVMMMMMMVCSFTVPGADSQQRQDSMKLDRHYITEDRTAEHGAVLQRRSTSRGSVKNQFVPQRNRILTQPSVSRTLSRHEHWPVPSLQDVINGLPSRNMGGKEVPVESRESWRGCITLGTAGFLTLSVIENYSTKNNILKKWIYFRPQIRGGRHLLCWALRKI